MAGKLKFSVEQIITAIREGHTPAGAAHILSCNPDTVRNYADRYTTVKTALLSERRALVDLAEIGLRSALVNREAWAIAFTLKTLGKNDGYTERSEIQNLNIDLTNLTDDQIKRLAAGEDLIHVVLAASG